MATKEEDFKLRFVAMMKNLHEFGTKDLQAVWLVGSLAARLVDKARETSWERFKATRTQRGYAQLLADLESQGNAFHTQGKNRQAYACQLLGMSLIARTQKDPDVQGGSKLLDEFVEHAITYYRKNKQAEYERL